MNSWTFFSSQKGAAVQARLWACGYGDVSTPSFCSHLNPISTRGGRLCPPYTGVNTKFWKPQVRLLYNTYYMYLFVKKKVFNYSELHFSEVTCYRIHTLRRRLKRKRKQNMTMYLQIHTVKLCLPCQNWLRWLVAYHFCRTNRRNCSRLHFLVYKPLLKVRNFFPTNTVLQE